MAHLTLYTKDPKEGECPFCLEAKAFLAARAIPYREEVKTQPERQALYAEWNARYPDQPPFQTVPQIFYHDDDGEIMPMGGAQALVISGIESVKAFLTQP